jgi:histone acetyltransferase (RNA polymerase elongator complex component)
MTNPLIIPIFLPFLGCRNRCLFCNQKATAGEVPSPSSIRTFIEASLLRIPHGQEKREKQVAFYGGSFTAIPRSEQIRYLQEIRSFIASGRVDSMRVSTRPDALGEEILSILKEYGVKTVEIGAQSMIDSVLTLARRGHGAEQTLSATSRLKAWGFEVGLQLMIGLPGDTLGGFLETLDRVIDLKPDFVRLHPTLVLRGAPLEMLWKTRRYAPLSLDETVQWLKKGILKLERALIPVARIGLQPTKELERDLLAGPYHPALRQLVESVIALDMAKHLLQNYGGASQACFLCHPGEVSNLRGQRNVNILLLRERFGLREICIQAREDVQRGSVILQSLGGEVSIHRKSLVL